ncbi:MAG TPA: polyphosphate kinase 2 family protein [Candidatus Limnocylindria bacterium]|nr:polyphosphate kinase 2 family protein [Candidatus Limnocylindria bacterium]
MSDKPGSKRGGKRDSLRDRLIVEPGSRVKLSDHDARETFGPEKDDAPAKIAADVERLAALQERLWAEGKRRVLIVLQGMDASGKDGIVKHVMTGFHPLGVRVVGFGVPSATELAHDYLWRIHQVVPGNGEIVIFNRSHYEDVLVVRVHSLVPEERWSRRYDQINDFERTLAQEGTTILKFFLRISPEEQLERFRDRYEDPTKRWKFKVGDLEERKHWDEYMAAYEDVLSRCSTDEAPWFIVPSDRKWFRDMAIADIVADTLADLDPQYPARDDLPTDLVME